MTDTDRETFERVYETLPGNGWLSKAEAALLWEYCNATKGPILEVGSYKGRSTVLLASFGRPVHCVDPFDGFDDGCTGDDVEREFRDNLHERGLTNVTHWRQTIERWAVESWATSLENWSSNQQPYGLCYLDGDHTYEGTVRQVQIALSLHPSVIAVHDVNDSGGGLAVKAAVLDVLRRPWTARAERLAAWS